MCEIRWWAWSLGACRTEGPVSAVRLCSPLICFSRPLGGSESWVSPLTTILNRWFWGSPTSACFGSLSCKRGLLVRDRQGRATDDPVPLEQRQATHSNPHLAFCSQCSSAASRAATAGVVGKETSSQAPWAFWCTGHSTLDLRKQMGMATSPSVLL